MMGKNMIVILALFTVFAISPAAGAATLYVGTDPGDYAAIQSAVAAAGTGDTVLIRTGTYTEEIIIDNYVTPGDSGSGSQDRTGLTIKEAVGANVEVRSPLYYGTIFTVRSDQVTIEGLDIYSALSLGYAYTIGIHLDGVDNCTIKDNRCGWDSIHKTQFGIYLTDSAYNNLIENNTCSYTDNVGIYLHGSQYNTLRNNTCNYALNAYGSEEGIRLYASNSNTISGNTCIGNPRGIELYYNNYDNIVVGNTCSLNASGLYLYASFRTIISGNTLTENTDGLYQTVSSYSMITTNTVSDNTGYGMYIFNSSRDNIIYLNSFSGNTTNNIYFDGGTGNLTRPYTQLAYVHNGFSRKNFLGNRYDDYAGVDADGDGIGDTAYTGTTFIDDYPLAAAPSEFILKTWYLSDSAMHGNSPQREGCLYEVPPGGSVVWVADHASTSAATFAAGDSADQSNWTYQFRVEEFFRDPVGNLTLTLGYADNDGGGFTSASGNPSTAPAAHTGSWGTQLLLGTFDSVQAFTVPRGKHLALKIDNMDDTYAFNVIMGGTWSYVSSSHPAPAYPVNPLTAAGKMPPVYLLLLLD